MKELLARASLMPMFVTEAYRTELAGTPEEPLLARLAEACTRLANEDEAGRRWAEQNGYLGYTSYDSIPDLPAREPAFQELKQLLELQAVVYARMIELDLRNLRPQVDSLWINTLDPKGAHSSHFHTHSAFSGTLYIEVPEGSGALKFEDPRLGLMMHGPMRYTNAKPFRQSFIALAPMRGTLMLWESWLRHEVSTNRGNGRRVSVSFNIDLH